MNPINWLEGRIKEVARVLHESGNNNNITYEIKPNSVIFLSDGYFLAYFEYKKEVKKIKCPICNGEGSISYRYGWAESCSLCQGRKEVRQSEIDHFQTQKKKPSYCEVVGANWDDF